MPFSHYLFNPSVLLHTSLVRLPRATPIQILRYTVPEGPWPFIVDVPVPEKRKRKESTIPVYVFVPPWLTETEEPPTKANDGRIRVPVMLDFHGGGFYMGSPLEQAPFCAQMARELSCVVLSVDYRMAPADPFPAAVEDAEDVLRAVVEGDGTTSGRGLRNGIRKWLARERQKKTGKKKGDEKSSDYLAEETSPLWMDLDFDFDTTRISIAGFSSGGNLALNLALSIPQNPPLVNEFWPSVIPLDHPNEVPLLLFYPSFDLRQVPNERSRPEGLAEGGAYFKWMSSSLVPTYVSGDKKAHPRASPGLAAIQPNPENARSGLLPQARMLLTLPSLDTLAEQSEIWIRKVQENGRGEHLEVKRHEGMHHGWTQFPVSMLGEKEKETRIEAFGRAVKFVKESWD
ncbi:MAG: hypothetical protein M1831_007267 [Alyxoria varia]|nr:MAG: hypothetical protein M1831_007267 [Alyxoria varia]